MNKLLLVVAIAAVIVITTYSLPTADAQTLFLCPDDNPNCCPPPLMPLCMGLHEKDPFDPDECPNCGIFELAVRDYLMINEARHILVAEKLDRLDTLVTGIDPVGDRTIIDVVLVGLLVGAIALGVANLARKR